MYCNGLARIVSDPVLRQTENGVSVMNIRLEFKIRFKGAHGKNIESDYTVDAECWDYGAETIARCCKKGDQLFVHGHMRNKKWVNKNGYERQKDTLRIDSFELFSPIEKLEESKAIGVGEE